MPIKLEVGQPAPDFDLPTAGGGRISLADLRGKKAIIYFYPEAGTSLCTVQACQLQDNLARLTADGFTVIGISPDPVEKLDKFAADQGLHFILAGDPSHHVMERWGTWGEKNMYGKLVMGTIRSTFAVDENGVLTLVKYRASTKNHVEFIRTKLGLTA